ncbi:hypothetical protein AV530_005310 [Patagioenas fasciata monilis]|uniref:Uncharacterized protein n=1 Tax=Patagioenas fasciata monilis TaxID=372326 RepID=A0A1V4JKX7_PATFA|nr:hypothetical protein AV530_005310 [Patagioenas fasciata monilis]
MMGPSHPAKAFQVQEFPRTAEGHYLSVQDEQLPSVCNSCKATKECATLERQKAKRLDREISGTLLVVCDFHLLPATLHEFAKDTFVVKLEKVTQ